MNLNQKKIRFNFIDAVILLIVLLVIAAAAYLIINDLTPDNNVRQTGTMDFTVRISSVDASALPLFTHGTLVKDSVSGKVIGEIATVRTEKTKYYGTVAASDGNGGYVVPSSEYDEKYDVYVTVLCSAELDARGIHHVGSTKVLIGSTVYFKIPSFTSISYITDYTLMPMG